MPTTTACLGPTPTDRCPDGAVVQRPRRRCRPCAATWAQAQVGRPPDAAEAAEHARLLAGWVAANGWWCPGDEGSRHGPHPVQPDTLTIHHLDPVVAGGVRVGGPKAVLCRTQNSRLGALVAGELRQQQEAGGAV